MDTAAAAELQCELGRHIRGILQGCILCQSVALDNAEKVVLDRKVSGCGRCKKFCCLFFLIGKSHEGTENTLQFSHMEHPLGCGKILGEICVLLTISETIKLSSSFYSL